MKNGLIILFFLTMSFTGFAQQDVIVNNETEVVETAKTIKSETSEATSASVSAEVKAKVLKINRKKSNEIISIKAYRKSLQIKVKTIKTC
ncbi:hypothetical protein HSX10_04600 [Winogradskyella undariae]|uniref:hypothetical protein n=1 Tax=Winogradskyella TaxID=286104 RepID=UPI00156AA14F|nr:MULTISPECIES: hypothetical protein [Winogradskyella]NRR90838.1 hypothetical protein [Winogradskyella undariae]QXP80185.1 hypothetical protein H0I32_06040 [Winogradskyella sp. HaHa_3_26]